MLTALSNSRPLPKPPADPALIRALRRRDNPTRHRRTPPLVALAIVAAAKAAVRACEPKGGFSGAWTETWRNHDGFRPWLSTREAYFGGRGGSRRRRRMLAHLALYIAVVAGDAPRAACARPLGIKARSHASKICQTIEDLREAHADLDALLERMTALVDAGRSWAR